MSHRKFQSRIRTFLTWIFNIQVKKLRIRDWDDMYWDKKILALLSKDFYIFIDPHLIPTFLCFSDGIIILDQERKIRREIANSNERRRMQSINAGFQSLRTLLPQHEGEKLSKVCF
jgi:hypothetical protein